MSATNFVASFPYESREDHVVDLVRICARSINFDPILKEFYDALHGVVSYAFR